IFELLLLQAPNTTETGGRITEEGEEKKTGEGEKGSDAGKSEVIDVRYREREGLSSGVLGKKKTKKKIGGISFSAGSPHCHQ
ncbi:hypothetical protein U1Q18_038075, partial [Sarracenia purpurea var. burkii]